jgi:hypothetical protein
MAILLIQELVIDVLRQDDQCTADCHRLDPGVSLSLPA